MLEKHQVEIEGVVYSFGLMPPTVAVPFQMKLAKLLVPLIGAVSAEKEKGMAIDTAEIAGAFSALSSEDTEYLLTCMQQKTTVGNEPCFVDKHFLGKTLVLYRVLFEFVRFNFADFFELIPGGIDIKEKLAGMKSQFLKTQSTGTSGDPS